VKSVRPVFVALVAACAPALLLTGSFAAAAAPQPTVRATGQKVPCKLKPRAPTRVTHRDRGKRRGFVRDHLGVTCTRKVRALFLAEIMVVTSSGKVREVSARGGQNPVRKRFFLEEDVACGELASPSSDSGDPPVKVFIRGEIRKPTGNPILSQGHLLARKDSARRPVATICPEVANG
jgi:hypothetical protein